MKSRSRTFRLDSMSQQSSQPLSKRGAWYPPRLFANGLAAGSAFGKGKKRERKKKGTRAGLGVRLIRRRSPVRAFSFFPTVPLFPSYSCAASDGRRVTRFQEDARCRANQNTEPGTVAPRGLSRLPRERKSEMDEPSVPPIQRRRRRWLVGLSVAVCCSYCGARLPLVWDSAESAYQADPARAKRERADDPCGMRRNSPIASRSRSRRVRSRPTTASVPHRCHHVRIRPGLRLRAIGDSQSLRSPAHGTHRLRCCFDELKPLRYVQQIDLLPHRIPS